MEYPPNENREWEVTVYDHNNKPMYHEKGLTRNEAHSLAERWIGRPDVGRVIGHDGI